MYAEAVTEYAKPLERVESETPAPQGTEVLVAITHCGVCHSDVHLHDGEFDMGGGQKLDVRKGRKLPFTLGHEIVGTVEAVGPDASGVSVGDKVVVYPWIGCGECAVCQRGDEHYCGKPRQIGINVDGGYATHVMVPKPDYCLDYGNMPAGQAAAFACSGLTAYAAIRKLGDIGAEDPVVLIGAGGVGMMGIQFFKAMYGRGPIVVDIDNAKLEAAKEAGAEAVFNPTDADALPKLMELTGGGAFGIIDFVGAEPTFGFANGAIRKGGKVVIVGLFGGAMSMPLPFLPMRAISFGGSYVGSLQEFKEAMELGRNGAVDEIPMEHRPLDQASKSLDDLREGHVMGRVILEV